MDSVLIVGSGPSAVHFALSLLRKKYRVTMLDVGYSKPPAVNPSDSFTALKENLADPVDYFLGERYGGHIIRSVGIFAARQNEISCVLLDLTMPKMDGVSALEKILDDVVRAYRDACAKHGRQKQLGEDMIWGAGLYLADTPEEAKRRVEPSHDERYKWFAPFGFVRYADEQGRTWGSPGAPARPPSLADGIQQKAWFCGPPAHVIERAMVQDRRSSVAPKESRQGETRRPHLG